VGALQPLSTKLSTKGFNRLSTSSSTKEINIRRIGHRYTLNEALNQDFEHGQDRPLLNKVLNQGIERGCDTT